jgi:hypothetical protein
MNDAPPTKGRRIDLRKLLLEAIRQRNIALLTYLEWERAMQAAEDGGHEIAILVYSEATLERLRELSRKSNDTEVVTMFERLLSPLEPPQYDASGPREQWQSIESHQQLRSDLNAWASARHFDLDWTDNGVIMRDDLELSPVCDNEPTLSDLILSLVPREPESIRRKEIIAKLHDAGWVGNEQSIDTHAFPGLVESGAIIRVGKGAYTRHR